MNDSKVKTVPSKPGHLVSSEPWSLQSSEPCLERVPWSFTGRCLLDLPNRFQKHSWIDAAHSICTTCQAQVNYQISSRLLRERPCVGSLLWILPPPTGYHKAVCTSDNWQQKGPQSLQKAQKLSKICLQKKNSCLLFSETSFVFAPCLDFLAFFEIWFCRPLSNAIA